MRRIGFILLLFILLLNAPASFAYIRNMTATTPSVPLTRVDNTAIQFYMNNQIVAGYQSSASGTTVNVISPGSNPQQAIRNALATWNAAGTANVKFLPLQQTGLGIDSTDFQMTVAIASTASELSFVSGALAVTVTAYATVPSNPGPNGTLFNCSSSCMYPAGGITDTDVIVDPAYAFSTDGSTAYDLQSVMTHEFGHSLSANHTGLLGASMYQINANQRYLTSDDLAFISSAYPLPNGPVPLGTISGTVTVAGAPVPYALLTAFDTTQALTVGGVTNPDGTYSFQVPPGTYQMYAEPLIGAVAINIYLSQTQLNLAQATKFQTTFYSGILNVAANGTATANIAVTAGLSSLGAPRIAATPVNGGATFAVTAGPVTVPSGQSVDLVLAGGGFTSALNNSNFTFYGQGITLQPGSVRADSTNLLGLNGIRLTLNVAARATPELVSFVVTSGASTLSFSGALVVVPPTPTFVPAGVISAAPYTGIPSGVSPGGIYSIYDIPGAPNLGPATYIQNGPYDAYGNLATNLAGVSVTFDGVPAPMFLSWGNQLNFQVPFEVAGKKTTQVVVNYFGSASAPVPVPVLAVQPGLFTSDGKAVRAYNLPGYTVNSAQNPAPKGSYVEVYGTGVGQVSYAIQTGQAAPAPPSGFTGNYTYSVGGSASAPALYGGWTPTASGLAQWDLQIPAGIASGAASIVVTDASGVSSQPGTTIFVQ